MLETVLFEPDHEQVLAVLPGALWLSAGDVVDVDGWGRDARVLSSRLQVSGDIARVLVFLDVGDEPAASIAEEVETDVAENLGLESPAVAVELDRDLAELESDRPVLPNPRQPQARGTVAR